MDWNHQPANIVSEATFTLLGAERHRRQKMRCGLTSSCGAQLLAGEVKVDVVSNAGTWHHGKGKHPSSSRMFVACMMTRKASKHDCHISSSLFNCWPKRNFEHGPHFWSKNMSNWPGLNRCQHFGKKFSRRCEASQLLICSKLWNCLSRVNGSDGKQHQELTIGRLMWGSVINTPQNKFGEWVIFVWVKIVFCIRF